MFPEQHYVANPQHHRRHMPVQAHQFAGVDGPPGGMGGAGGFGDRGGYGYGYSDGPDWFGGFWSNIDGRSSFIVTTTVVSTSSIPTTAPPPPASSSVPSSQQAQPPASSGSSSNAASTSVNNESGGSSTGSQGSRSSSSSVRSSSTDSAEASSSVSGSNASSGGGITTFSGTSSSSAPSSTAAGVGANTIDASTAHHSLSSGAIAAIAVIISLLFLSALAYILRICRRRRKRNDVAPYFMSTGPNANATREQQTPESVFALNANVATVGVDAAARASTSPLTPSGSMNKKFVVFRERGGSTSITHNQHQHRPGVRTMRRAEIAALMARLADRIRERDELQLQRSASRQPTTPGGPVFDISTAAVSAALSVANVYPAAASPTDEKRTTRPPMSDTAAAASSDTHTSDDIETQTHSPQSQSNAAPNLSDWRDAHIRQQDVHINQLSSDVAQLQAALARYENEPSVLGHDEMLPRYESESGSGHEVRV